MKDDITCVFEGVAGVGAIYISNLKAAQNQTILQRFDIKAILTVVRGGNVKHPKQDVENHLYVPADDVESYDLSKHFEQTYAFIEDVRKKTNVLVHCYAGISRSATIVIAYLLKKFNYSLTKVISIVKRRRNKINPNRGFLEQLKQEAIKMNIPVDESEFEELVKPSNKKALKEIKRPLSVPRVPLRCTIDSWLPKKSIQMIKEQENDCQDNLENKEVHKKFTRTSQKVMQGPKQISPNQMISPVKRDLAMKKMLGDKMGMDSKSIEKYPSMKTNRELSSKIERIKARVMEKNGGKNKKRTMSNFDPSAFSPTLAVDLNNNKLHEKSGDKDSNFQIKIRQSNNF